jgi:polyisoprenoid-binding protein YceI
MLVFAVAALGLTACNATPEPSTAPRAVSAPSAVVPSASGSTPTTTTASTSAGVLKFSGETSKIEFIGTKDRGKHDGGFKTFTGTIDGADADFTKATVKLEIDMNSIFTDNPSVTNHLKNQDFFEVRTYPKADFTSTDIKATTAGGATHEITGNLTIHGTTKPVTVPVKVTSAADGTTLEGTFKLKRLEFNVNYRPDAVHNDVTVRLTIKATK